MQITIGLEDKLLHNVLMLQRVEEGKEGNYTRVEGAVSALRYNISDRILTLVMVEVDRQNWKKPIIHTYDKK